MFMFWEETTVQRTATRRHFPTSQPIKFNCSKLFNLKTDGGMSNKKVSKSQVRKLNISNVTEKERALKKQLGSFIKAFTSRISKALKDSIFYKDFKLKKGKQVSITGMMGRYPGEPL